MKTHVVFGMAVLLAMPAFASAAGGSDVAAAREAVAEMNQAEAIVEALLQSAKADGDAVKVSCLDDKAKQIRGYAAGGRKALTRASFLSSDEAASTYVGILTDVASVRSLRNDANGCVGADEVAAAEEEVASKDQKKVEPFELGKPAEAVRSGAGVPVRSPAPASPTL